MTTKITESKLRKIIREIALKEFGGLSGGMRQPGRGKQQFKIGKVEEEAREISSTEVESKFPEAVEAWVEIGPTFFPDLEPNIDIFDDDPVAKAGAWLNSSIFFIENGQLSVAAASMPNIKLMIWDDSIGDWVDALPDEPNNDRGW